jgi:hypothetical protein
MITAEEVVRTLPMLLKEHPELRTEIYEIISDEFVRRGEFYDYMKKRDERFEIDLCITNEECLIFEIKSYAEEEDIERFNDKAELAKKNLSLKKKALPKKNLKKVEKALITLEKHPSVVKLCDKFGILVG